MLPTTRQDSKVLKTLKFIDSRQVILADGSLVNANEKSNPDLYWALKGGSNNFGIKSTMEQS